MKCFSDLLTKGHSGCWDPDDFKALSVNFAFAHGLLEGSGIVPNYTIIFSFHFFIPFSVVNLEDLLIARYMSCKLPSKLAGSSNMNEQLSPSMIIIPNTINHTVIFWIKIISYK